jgi:hypothetical protein
VKSVRSKVSAIVLLAAAISTMTVPAFAGQTHFGLCGQAARLRQGREDLQLLLR